MTFTSFPVSVLVPVLSVTTAVAAEEGEEVEEDDKEIPPKLPLRFGFSRTLLHNMAPGMRGRDWGI